LLLTRGTEAVYFAVELGHRHLNSIEVTYDQYATFIMISGFNFHQPSNYEAHSC